MLNMEMSQYTNTVLENRLENRPCCLRSHDRKFKWPYARTNNLKACVLINCPPFSLHRSTVICASEKCYLHEMKGADFLSFLETSPETKSALLNMCRKRLFKKAVKKYALEHNRGFSNEDLIKAFELADSDKNGDLDFEEVKKIMHSMDPTIPEKDIIELMNYIDVDHDGKLSFTVSLFLYICSTCHYYLFSILGKRP